MVVVDAAEPELELQPRQCSAKKVRRKKTYAVPDAELVDAWVDAEPPEEEAPLVAEEPADEVVASVEAALELVDEAPVAVLLEPEPDAADEEPELVRQLSAAVHDHSQHPLFEPRQIRGTYSQTAR